MKLRLLTSLPLVLASCSELPTADQDPPPTPPPATKLAPVDAPLPETPAPVTISAPIPDGPENPLGFLDPDTTGELMTDEKKKTVSSAQENLPPAPIIEGEDAIDVDPPKLPELKD